jgi:hypothetical protein
MVIKEFIPSHSTPFVLQIRAIRMFTSASKSQRRDDGHRLKFWYWPFMVTAEHQTCYVLVLKGSSALPKQHALDVTSYILAF